MHHNTSRDHATSCSIMTSSTVKLRQSR